MNISEIFAFLIKFMIMEMIHKKNKIKIRWIYYINKILNGNFEKNLNNIL